MLLLINSFWVILAAIITRGFFIRWLNIAHRKLAIEQIRKKMASQAEEETRTNQAQTSEASATTSTEELDIDVSHISKQTLKLLNNFTGFVLSIQVKIVLSKKKTQRIVCVSVGTIIT